MARGWYPSEAENLYIFVGIGVGWRKERSKAQEPHGGVFKALWTCVITQEQEEKSQPNSNCTWTTFKDSVAVLLPRKSSFPVKAAVLWEVPFVLMTKAEDGQKVFMNQLSKFCRALAEQTPPKTQSSSATKKDLSKAQHSRGNEVM